MPSKQNIAIKFVLVLFVCATHFALTLIACSCGNTNSSEDLKESNDGRPFLVVHGTDSELGAQNVEVIVEIKNNPGILGIDFEIYYDDMKGLVILPKVLENFDKISIFDIFGENFYQGEIMPSIKIKHLLPGVYRIELYNNRVKENRVLIVN